MLRQPWEDYLSHCGHTILPAVQTQGMDVSAESRGHISVCCSTQKRRYCSINTLRFIVLLFVSMTKYSVRIIQNKCMVKWNHYWHLVVGQICGAKVDPCARGLTPIVQMTLVYWSFKDVFIHVPCGFYKIAHRSIIRQILTRSLLQQ